MDKQLVLMGQDGAIEDLLATMLLLRMEQVQPLGVVVTPADCYLDSGVGATRKILDLMGCSAIPVAASTVRGMNPFPPNFRRDSLIVDQFPILNEHLPLRTPLLAESGQDFIVRVLQSASQPITFLETGPLTTLAAALTKAPDIAAKIAKIVWMGGALRVPGNVEFEYAPEHDGSAEWNVFWDPIAAAQVWQTEIPLVLCPLDVTNTVPVTAAFVAQLAQQRRYPLSDLAGLCYALAIPQQYYCWDTLATVYLDRPEFYELEVLETGVITSGRSQGRIQIQPGGRPIQAIMQCDHLRFLEYLLKQFQA